MFILKRVITNFQYNSVLSTLEINEVLTTKLAGSRGVWQGNTPSLNVYNIHNRRITGSRTVYSLKFLLAS